MNRTFLLGVGAMKAGTTWLHDYLAASPQCEPGVRKEYHVFDSLDLEHEPYLLGRVVEKARGSLEHVAHGRPTDPTHVAFGSGEHFCLGASLARLEARVLFEELLERFPAFSLAGEIVPLRSTLMNGLVHMPVTFGER